MVHVIIARIVVVLIAVFSLEAFAGSIPDPITDKKTVPLWEIKLFGAGFYLPHYRGSDEYEAYAVPVPYFEYRGEFFRIDSQGVHGIFFRSEHLETALSAFGNPPVNQGNEARRGMAELDPLVELGPALKWYPLGRRCDISFYVKSTVRGVVSSNFPDSLRSTYQGIHGEVNLVCIDHSLFGRPDWEARATLGIDVTDNDYNAYFYTVSEHETQPGRPAYNAGGGYGGMFVSGRLVNAITDRFSVTGYGRWENLSGAVFEDSPLVKTKNNFSLGIMLSWTPLVSKKQVDATYLED